MALSDIIIVLVSCLAAFFDFWLRKIPNWLIAFGLASALTLSAFHGLNLLLLSILGFVVGIGALFLPFAFGWIGAGDVKYLGVVGALLGAGLLPRVFFYSALVAGAITFIYLALGIGTKVSFKDQWTGLKTALLSMGRILPDPVSVQTRRSGGSVPWGVAFAAGTLLAYYVDRDGSWAGF